jgi:hypothetical protein
MKANMQNAEKLIEDLIGDNDLSIDNEIQHSWGKEFSFSISNVNVDLNEVFGESKRFESIAHGVDENFNDTQIFLVELGGEEEIENHNGETIENVPALIFTGWHSAGEYTDEDYEGYMSGSMAWPDADKYDEALICMENKYRAESLKSGINLLNNALKIVMESCGNNKNEILAQPTIRDFIRLMAA